MAKANNFYAPLLSMNTTDTSAQVTALSPGSRYTLQVSALRGRFAGLPDTVVAVTTGEQIPVVYDLQATGIKGETVGVKLQWQPPKDKRKLKWQYGVYYGVNLKVSRL